MLPETWTISHLAYGLPHWAAGVLWVEAVWLPFGRLAAELNVRPRGSWNCPRMSQCTYCKDVYVGLLRLRVIYLPTDHDVTLEISGEIYLKYVAFFFFCHFSSNTGGFLFLSVHYYYYCSSHSRADPLCHSGHSLPRQDLLVSRSHTHRLQLFHTSWNLFVWELLLTSAVSLQQSTAEHFLGLTVPIFQTGRILQNLWNITGDWFFSRWLHEQVEARKEAALFNKLSHVIQSDWN